MTSNPDGLAGGDADALLRAISQLRERMRLQEVELDNLRTTTRFLHQQNEREPSASGSAPPQSLLDRIARLEAGSGEQAHTAQQVLAVLARTDGNLQRLAAELDRLLAQIAIPVAPVAPFAPPVSAPFAPPGSGPPISEPPVTLVLDANPFPPAPPTADFETIEDEDDQPPRAGWKGSIVGLVVLVALLIGAVLVIRHARRIAAANDVSASAASTPMARAKVFENEKKYPEAESIYRGILKRSPDDRDAIRHLASVLFRQGRIEESSVVLKRLLPNGSDQ